ncbi:MAG: hypothetical protein RLZZ408_1682 [Verrucomicrobiota bacterium]
MERAASARRRQVGILRCRKPSPEIWRQMQEAAQGSLKQKDWEEHLQKCLLEMEKDNQPPPPNP